MVLQSTTKEEENEIFSALNIVKLFEKILGEFCPTILKSRLTQKLRTMNTRSKRNGRIIIMEMLM